MDVGKAPSMSTGFDRGNLQAQIVVPEWPASGQRVERAGKSGA